MVTPSPPQVIKDVQNHGPLCFSYILTAALWDLISKGLLNLPYCLKNFQTSVVGRLRNGDCVSSAGLQHPGMGYFVTFSLGHFSEEGKEWYLCFSRAPSGWRELSGRLSSEWELWHWRLPFTHIHGNKASLKGSCVCCPCHQCPFRQHWPPMKPPQVTTYSALRPEHRRQGEQTQYRERTRKQVSLALPLKVETPWPNPLSLHSLLPHFPRSF